MEILVLLDYVGGLNEQQKEQLLDEEFIRQKAFVDALCNAKRKEYKNNGNY